jgi:hypothetical protein
MKRAPDQYGTFVEQKESGNDTRKSITFNIDCNRTIIVLSKQLLSRTNARTVRTPGLSI